MPVETLEIGGQRFTLETLNLATATRARLDEVAAELFGLFLAREEEFGFSPDVVTEYPDVAAEGGFLDDPLGHIAARRHAADGQDFDRIVILTTYADRIGPALVAAGYAATPIIMPAGPDHTSASTLNTGSTTGQARTLYLEAVNEADEKIRPSFALRLLDQSGALAGGACGSVHDLDGHRYAYLATMTLAGGLPPTTGTRLGQALLQALARDGVRTVHLGTQTAGPFYDRLGFRTTLRLVSRLRFRSGPDGQPVWHDLVMMACDLPAPH